MDYESFECLNLHPCVLHSPVPICHPVCVCEEKCGCAGVFTLFYHLKHSAEPRPSYHVPYSIPLLVRVNGAQNTYHLLPTCVNMPLAPPQATVSLTLHLLSCSLHALTILPPLYHTHAQCCLHTASPSTPHSKLYKACCCSSSLRLLYQ